MRGIEVEIVRHEGPEELVDQQHRFIGFEAASQFLSAAGATYGDWPGDCVGGDKHTIKVFIGGVYRWEFEMILEQPECPESQGQWDVYRMCLETLVFEALYNRCSSEQGRAKAKRVLAMLEVDPVSVPMFYKGRRRIPVVRS